MADPTQVHQIVMNICSNAAQAMAQTGGTLAVDLTDERIDQKPVHPQTGLNPGNYLKLSISDSGSGMPPNVGGPPQKP